MEVLSISLDISRELLLSIKMDSMHRERRQKNDHHLHSPCLWATALHVHDLITPLSDANIVIIFILQMHKLRHRVKWSVRADFKPKTLPSL